MSQNIFLNIPKLITVILIVSYLTSNCACQIPPPPPGSSSDGSGRGDRDGDGKKGRGWLKIVIPIVGGLILLALIWYIVRCIKNRRANKAKDLKQQVNSGQETNINQNKLESIEPSEALSKNHYEESGSTKLPALITPGTKQAVFEERPNNGNF